MYKDFLGDKGDGTYEPQVDKRKEVKAPKQSWRDLKPISQAPKDSTGGGGGAKTSADFENQKGEPSKKKKKKQKLKK